MRRRQFTRPLGQRRYRRLFVISAEGMECEPCYFAMFSAEQSTFLVKCLRGDKGSAPFYVLGRMVAYIKKYRLKPHDEAWLVVDTDQWTVEQLAPLHAWTKQKDNYHLAVSNPKFEYWLLLHFENGKGITNSRDCSDRLKRHLPHYHKSVNPRTITLDKIDDAIRRAQRRDVHPCNDWPRTLGTTVYRLVQKIRNLMS